MYQPIKLFPILIALVAALLAGVGLYLFTSYEVIDKGNILPYTDGFVYKLLIGGKYTVYVEPELRMTLDIFNAFILAGVAFIALTFAGIWYSYKSEDSKSHFWFFALLSIGTLYLAADELLGIHESLGHNAQFLSLIPGINRPDDFIIVLYGLGALLFVLYFHRILLDNRRAWWFFVAAISIMAVSIAFDVFSVGLEEVLEILAGMLVVAGTLSLGVDTLSGRLSNS